MGSLSLWVHCRFEEGKGEGRGYGFIVALRRGREGVMGSLSL